MIPDRIFVSSDPFGFMPAYYIENHPPYGEEYIRKDALLEWAKEKAEDYKGTANIRRSFEMMIRKIESL